MEITYVQTTQSNLNNVPVVNGQVIYTSDTGNQYSDISSSRKRNVFGDEIESVKDMISDAYDSTLTYVVGDYCIYNNVLYKCNTAIATPEAFTPAKWDATTATEELRELTDAVENVATTEEVIGVGQCSSVGSPEEFTLTKPITNYRLITIVLCFYNGWLASQTLTPNRFRYFVTDWIRVSSGESYADIKYVNDSKISVEMTNVSTQWWRIHGIV